MKESVDSRRATPLWLLIRLHGLQMTRRLLAVREQSKLLSGLIALFVLGYALIAFWLFKRGLEFVDHFPGLGGMLTERLMFLLFAFLFALLLLSNLIISYTNLFRNRETLFLLTLPIPAQTIFRWKFLESTLLASWAFLFLVAPMLAAYGLTQHAAWHFYLMTVCLLGLFLVLPAVAGSWCAIQLARYLDRRSFQVIGITLALGALAAAAWWFRPEPINDRMLETRVLVLLDRLLQKTEFAQFPWLPSYWLSAGVLQWAEGALSAAFFFAFVLLSYALFFGFLAFTRMGGSFYDASSAVQSRGAVLGRWGWFQRWKQRRRVVDRKGLLEWVIGLLPRIRSDVRALLVKDIRIFWRDTAQWGQTLMLFGLLGVYIINLRHFSRQLTNVFWVHLVSYLNLGACSLNLATLTTRFVYPQFSLEGKRVWIVGLAPLGLSQVVRTKYWLANAASLVVTVTLMGLSCRMLRMPWGRTLYFMAAVSLMTFTLNGLAIGLGTLYPNFKEDHPGKIVSGFGGTFCLVLSFLYTVGSVVLLALGSPWAEAASIDWMWLAGTWAVFLALSGLLGWLPLKLGLRRLASLEL